MKIEIQIAVPSDYLLLSDIGRRTFYETWRPVNTEEDMHVYIKKSFNPLKIKEDVELFSVNTFFLAFAGEEAIGYVKLRRDRTYDEFKDEMAIEIERIYVLKEWQDKKIGKSLMDRCIHLALEEKFKWLWLGVNTGNIKAINFYKRYGFTIFGEKSFQLGEAVDIDYLMKKEITSISRLVN